MRDELLHYYERELSFIRRSAGDFAERYPEVAEALKALSEYSEPRMSGTGASVFARFEQYEDAEDVLNKLTAAQLKNNWSMFIAKGLNESPLATFLRERTTE